MTEQLSLEDRLKEAVAPEKKSRPPRAAGCKPPGKPKGVHITLQLPDSARYYGGPRALPRTIYWFTPKAALAFLEAPFYGKPDPGVLSKLKVKALWQEHQGSYVKVGPPIDYNTTLAFDSPEGLAIGYQGLDFTKPLTYDQKRALIQATLNPPPNDMRHYKALVAEAKRVGWPTSYAEDLTKHDQRSCCYRDPRLPFGWILRESGTHFVPAESAVDKRPPGSAYADIMRGSYASVEGSCKFYIWDGVSLHSHSPARWAEKLDSLHRQETPEPY